MTIIRYAAVLPLLIALSGFAAAADVQTAASQAAMTPDQAIARLREGNARFVANKPMKRNETANVRATAGGQYPFAAVLGCMDSRVPLELAFDQGIGDLV